MNKLVTALLLALVVSAPLAAQSEREAAVALYNDGKYAEAADAFEDIYKRQPDEFNYNYLLNCYNALKNYSEAEKTIERRIRKNNDARLFIDLGYYQKLQKKDTEAVENFNKAIVQVSQNAGLAYPVSEHFSKYALYREALITYEAAERANPGMAFHYQKALIYAELGDLSNMYQEYLNLIEQSGSYYANVRERMARNISDDPTNESNEILRKLLIKKIQETNNELYIQLLVWLYTEEGQYGKALIQLKALDKRQGNMDPEIYSLGLKTLDKKEYPIALESFDYIVGKGDLSAYYEEAVYSRLKTKRLTLQDKPASSKTEFQDLVKEHLAGIKLVGNNEQLVYINNDIADILYFQLSLKDSALSLLEHMIIQYNNTYKKPVAYSKMLQGKMLLASGKNIDAIFRYMEVERAFADSPLGDEAKLMKGMVAYYNLDFLWALNQFEVLKSSTTKLISNDALEMALLITDNSVEDTLYQGLTYYAKADLFQFRNMPDSALKILDLLLSVFPDHAIKEEALLMESRILFRQGRYAEALNSLNKILINGGDIWADDALMLQGEIYAEKLGDPEKAMKSYERILFDHPGSTFVPEARRRYRKLRGDKLN